MGTGNKILSRIKKPKIILLDLLFLFSGKLNDKRYLKIRYLIETGHFLNLRHPKTFNQKLQWLKLNKREEWLTLMVDKYRAKEIVGEKIGGEFIIPTFEKWDSPDDITIANMPKRFVMKTNHDSGGVVICKDKDSFNLDKAKETLRFSFNRDYYWAGREWPYKNIKKCIIAEQYIEDSKGELFDYKFFCFNGKVKFLKVDFDRQIDHRANYYSPTWELLPFGEVVCPPKSDKIIERPANLGEMVELAEKLASGVEFVRIDFYDIDGRIYFGEFTLFPASGFGKFIPESYDKVLGKMLMLPVENE